MRWEDNTRERTGPEFAKSQRAVENIEKWRKTGCEIICGAPKTLAVKESVRWGAGDGGYTGVACYAPSSTCLGVEPG